MRPVARRAGRDARPPLPRAAPPPAAAPAAAPALPRGRLLPRRDTLPDRRRGLAALDRRRTRVHRRADLVQPRGAGDVEGGLLHLEHPPLDGTLGEFGLAEGVGVPRLDLV